MTTPFTREEIDTIPDDILLELINNNSPRLYPHCLIGQNIHQARKQFKEWTKGQVEILIHEKDKCEKDYNTCYFYCHINEDDIITEIWKSSD